MLAEGLSWCHISGVVVWALEHND